MPMQSLENATGRRMADTCWRRGFVRPCEVVLTESPAHLRKEFDRAAGIALTFEHGVLAAADLFV
jgi:hypothetical protein